MSETRRRRRNCVWTRLALGESRWMCGCGRLILVESGAHSWTIIGLYRCCVQLTLLKWVILHLWFLSFSVGAWFRRRNTSSYSPDSTGLRRVEQLTVSSHSMFVRLQTESSSRQTHAKLMLKYLSREAFHSNLTDRVIVRSCGELQVNV